MSIKKFDRFMGEPIAGSIEKLSNAKDVQKNSPASPIQPAQPTQPVASPTPTQGIVRPQEYVLLPAATHGKYSYPDMLVSMNLVYPNSNWHQAHTSLSQMGAQMLTIRQFVDFLNVLRSGKAYDGNGMVMDKSMCDKLLERVFGLPGTAHDEWLDAKFEERGRGGFLWLGVKRFININYEHTMQNGQLIPSYSEELTDYLDCNRSPGIDLTSWLENANEHGLPRRGIHSGDLYYTCPTHDRAALFVTCKYALKWSGLHCHEEPLDPIGTHHMARPAFKKI